MTPSEQKKAIEGNMDTHMNSCDNPSTCPACNEFRAEQEDFRERAKFLEREEDRLKATGA